MWLEVAQRGELRVDHADQLLLGEWQRRADRCAVLIHIHQEAVLRFGDERLELHGSKASGADLLDVKAAVVEEADLGAGRAHRLGDLDRTRAIAEVVGVAEEGPALRDGGHPDD